MNFSPSTITPLFIHDCDSCKFCGNFVDIKNDGYANEIFDLYYCPVDMCLIARFGKEGCQISVDFELGSTFEKEHPIGYLYQLLKSRRLMKRQK